MAVQPEHIESVIVLRGPAPHQLVKLWLTFGIKMDDFAVQDGLSRNRRPDGGAKLREAFVNRPLPRYQPALTRIDVRERDCPESRSRAFYGRREA